MNESRSQVKPFDIPKSMVWEAYQRVRANKGAAGVDGQPVEQFEQDLRNNLYRLWNRMSSGSYFPPPVKAVEIPKASGGVRILGIPTVADRIAQTVVAMFFGAAGGTGIPSRFLWLPSRAVGAGRGGGVPGTLLAERLGSAGINRLREGTWKRPTSKG